MSLTNHWLAKHTCEMNQAYPDAERKFTRKLSRKNMGRINAKEIKFRLDDAAILAVAAKVAAQEAMTLDGDEEAVLAALRRAHPSAGNTNEELGHWLSKMDEGQLQGVISNTKGVLHEMRFVELENADGDTTYVAQFAATNHPGFDVVFSDVASGSDWEAQLKATDSEAYVREWLESHPDGQILVTTEIAERMGVASSGVSNTDLTMETERLVDSLIAADESDTLWDYLPGLSALSMAMVIYELHQRLKLGEIGPAQFRWMVAKASGQKATRVVALTILLSIPVVNVITGIALIANALSASGVLKAINGKLDKFNESLSHRLEAGRTTAAFEMAIFTEKLCLEMAIKRARQDLEIQRRCRDEAFRRAYEEATTNLKKCFAEADLIDQTDRTALEYSSPDDCLPLAVNTEGVALRVNAKVNALQVERIRRLQEVNRFLKNEELRPHFHNALEEEVGPEAAAKLARLIAVS
jgi:hypothetical protein